MMNKNKTQKRKIPISIILIIVWMVIAIISTLIKQFDMERLATNKIIMGVTLALLNYMIDFIILFGFVIFLFLFWKRKNIWKYFIYFIVFLMIGELLSFALTILNIDKALEVVDILGILTPTSLIISSLFVILLHLTFYFVVIYFTYKNRGYFEK